MMNNITIFYADDDSDDLDFFTDVTQSIGENLQLHTFTNGDKLLAAIKDGKEEPNVIFLDLNMPGKSGFDVLKELKGSTAYKNIPVVVFSTSNDQYNIAKSRELGANYFVTKPDSFGKFKKSIEHTLSINWTIFNPNLKEFVYQTVV